MTADPGGAPLHPACCEPAPDRSGRICDLAKGHAGEHWTYGGDTLKWGGAPPVREPEKRAVTLEQMADDLVLLEIERDEARAELAACRTQLQAMEEERDDMSTQVMGIRHTLETREKEWAEVYGALGVCNRGDDALAAIRELRAQLQAAQQEIERQQIWINRVSDTNWDRVAAQRKISDLDAACATLRQERDAAKADVVAALHTTYGIAGSLENTIKKAARCETAELEVAALRASITRLRALVEHWRIASAEGEKEAARADDQSSAWHAAGYAEAFKQCAFELEAALAGVPPEDR